MSIVLASLGILRSIWQIISFIGLLFISQMAFPMMQAGAGGGMTPAGTLTAADADTIVAALSGSAALATPDQARLSAAIQQSDIPLAPPPLGQAWTQAHVTQQLTSGVSTAGSATYTFPTGTITMSGREIVIAVASAGGGISTTTIGTGGTATFRMPSNPFGGFSLAIVGAGIATEAVGLGLAILLLTAGIATLRASPRAPGLHRWWAWLKIPAVVASTAVGIWMAFSLFDSFDMTATQTNPGGATTVVTPPFQSMGWLMLIPAILMGLIGCVYPVVVLFLLRSKTFREYYTNQLPAERGYAG
jgi:hypothetical protein